MMLVNPPDPQLESLDGSTYRLLADYKVDFASWLFKLQFTIPAGFLTDIASVPRPLRWLFDRADLGLLSPIVHDYLCENKGQIVSNDGELIKVSWFDSALFFLIIMRIDGIPGPKAFCAFLAVVIGGPRWS